MTYTITVELDPAHAREVLRGAARWLRAVADRQPVSNRDALVLAGALNPWGPHPETPIEIALRRLANAILAAAEANGP